MNKSSQLIPIILTLVFFANYSCKKETPKEIPNTNDAIITGSDVRMCICCGGLMITFDGETKPYTGNFRRISNPGALGLTQADTFPIYVNVDWMEDTTNVCHTILITRIARR